MEEHSVPVYKWRLLLDSLVNNGLYPHEASIATLCPNFHLVNGSICLQLRHLQ